MSALRTATFIIVPVLIALLAMFFYIHPDPFPSTWPVLLRQLFVTFPLLNFWHYHDFTEDDIPDDLSGKVVLITGASSGIGYESARILASRGAKVVLGIRGDRERLDRITSSLLQLPGLVLAPAPLDLSNYDTIRTFVRSLPNAGIDHFDIVMLNAGRLIPEYNTDYLGIESALAVHHIGHAYLFELLTPMLLKSSGEIRVVITSSVAHIWSFPEGIRYDILQADFSSPFVAYANSKLANLLYTRELSIHLEESYPGKFVVNAAHPGLVLSASTADGPPRFLMYSTVMGALAILKPAVGHGVRGDGYYLPVGYRGDWQKDSAYWWTCNDTMRKEFWNWTEAILKKVHGDREMPRGSLMLGQ
ncbi:restnol dehydrogenase, putative [Perkinsus marinus ATCC 50983]|uniref:Restnol dehydrogenase, putative n=1 Tax=Perkinsus marinus (strain ATCC 50983 / TXsc) TaxID=423536 RepID=C5K7J7_PERM5|nr:restnol dehydrogenase, putative [Perkinsus marinus ATCC 50983]EER19532.1 restnol dehydrogenase, putative [Perkinsus marinus ATCC 50983]|eukprot:XP_002787736.1 restnol dehydrogenase, putative [Perkinsus marinus ATCC 50983]